VHTALALMALFIGGFAAYALWARAAYHAGAALWWLVLGAPLLYLAVFALFTAMWFALAWMHRAPRPPEARIGPLATLRMFIEEWLTLLGSGLRMGFAWWFMREPTPAAGVPVLLVHGVLCNAGVWLGMRCRLRGAGLGPVHTISLEPPLASIDDFAEQLSARIDEICAASAAPAVALVGHSMGGIVARAYLRAHGDSRVAKVITLGSPHAGSVHAGLFFGESVRQLRRGNAWLEALNREPLPAVPIVSIWSWHDSMVAPQDSSRLPGAENIALSGIGHNALLRNARVRGLVIDALRTA
jgi:triacylglycerol esterase/lipase EstA (alpha/beta hydrolase family)